MNVIIVDEKENKQETMENLMFSHEDANQISSMAVEMDSGTSVTFRTPEASNKGFKPEIVILRTEVSDETFEEIDSMVARHGVLIDER